MALPLVLLGLGFLVCVIGTIMLLVAAFRESVMWGLIVFFAPFGNVIYACVHWTEGKAGLLTTIAGIVLIGAGGATLPNASLVFSKALEGKFVDPGAKEPEGPDLNAQIAEKRKTLEDLQAAFVHYGQDLPGQYQALEKRRKSLKTGDEAGIAKFNEDAAAYQARNKQHKEIQQSIATAQAELDRLLEQRSRANVAARQAPAK